MTWTWTLRKLSRILKIVNDIEGIHHSRFNQLLEGKKGSIQHKTYVNAPHKVPYIII